MIFVYHKGEKNCACGPEEHQQLLNSVAFLGVRHFWICLREVTQRRGISRNKTDTAEPGLQVYFLLCSIQGRLRLV